MADYYPHEAELEGRPASRGSELGTHGPALPQIGRIVRAPQAHKKVIR
jgi:hypothetical protein